MSENNLTDNLWTALLMARGEIHPIAKRAENPHFGSRYADLASIVEAVVPVLARHGLVLTQPVACADGRVTVTTDVVHAASGVRESLAAVSVPLGRGDAQAVGSAITYARRYGLASGLCLAIDDDDDGEAAVGRGPSSVPRQVRTTRATDGVPPSPAAGTAVPPPPPPSNVVSLAPPPTRPTRDWRIPVGGGAKGERIAMSEASPEHLERFAQWMESRIAGGKCKPEYVEQDREQAQLARAWAAWHRHVAATAPAPAATSNAAEPPPTEEPPPEELLF